MPDDITEPEDTEGTIEVSAAEYARLQADVGEWTEHKEGFYKFGEMRRDLTTKIADLESQLEAKDESLDSLGQYVKGLEPVAFAGLLERAGFQEGSPTFDRLHKDLSEGQIQAAEGETMTAAVTRFALAEYGWEPAYTPRLSRTETQQLEFASRLRGLHSVMTDPPNPNDVETKTGEAMALGDTKKAISLQTRKLFKGQQ